MAVVGVRGYVAVGGRGSSVGVDVSVGGTEAVSV